jgi:hypothetical protein
VAVDYNRRTEIAEMGFLRPEEAESKERKQNTEIYLWFIYRDGCHISNFKCPETG